MIRLCAFDLDGTLLDPHGRLSPGNAGAVVELSESGTVIALISGRPPCYTGGFFHQLGICGFTAASNGAFISSPEGDIIRFDPFPERLTAQITSLLDENGARYALQTVNGIIGNKEASSSISERFINYCSMVSSFGIDTRLPLTDPIIGGRAVPGVLKIAVTGGSLPLQDYQAAISSAFPSLTVSFSGATVLDINLPGNSKGNALEMICSHLGVSRDDVCSFGDYNNDIPMFRSSGISFAMGNAGDAVKSEADHITAPNYDDGVAEAIRRTLLPLNNEVSE
ncbi:MAG: HAD family hydrolase [Oscillospiraceae bacterium]|nr:HAD family hydrolase [Oscillospiraceae bacterium]